MNNINKPARRVFAILDLGSSKIFCAIIKISTDGLDIIGHSKTESKGLKGGMITDISESHKCITNAIEEAEKMANETVDQTYVIISGSDIKSNNITSLISTGNVPITTKEIRKLMKQGNENYNGNDVIIHSFPIDYKIDQINGIKNPLEMYGNHLEARICLITAIKASLINLQSCIGKCNLNMIGCIAEPYASGMSCLTNEELIAGATIVDIGGSYTSIATFKNKTLMHLSSIPIGGVHITKDIAYGLSIDLKTAEEIKINYGNVILTSANEEDLIKISTEDGKDCEFSKLNLVNIIRPRVEEILEMILKNTENHPLGNKIIITGGTSQITSLRELASHILNLHVRIGNNITNYTIEGHSKDSSLSAIFGSLKILQNMFFHEDDSYNVKDKTKGAINKVISWIKHNI